MGSFKLFTARITTDGSGDAAVTYSLIGKVHAVDVALGTLTTPDVTITDDQGTELLAVTGLAADARYLLGGAMQGDDGADIDGQPAGDPTGSFAAPVVLGSVTITVAGGGASKTGTVKLLCER